MHDGHVPGDHHGNGSLFTRFQGEADCNCGVDLLVTTDPGFVAVGQTAIRRESLPQGIRSVRPLAAVDPGGLIAHLYTRSFLRSDDPLAIPLIGGPLGTLVIEHDTLNGASGCGFIEKFIEIACRLGPCEVAREGAECSQ